MTEWTTQGRVTRIPGQFCPRCFKLLDATSALTHADDVPVPGDYTVCIQCAAVLRFGTGLQLELSSLMDIPEHSRLPFAQTVQMVQKLFGDRWDAPKGRTI
jgi:hypothetical protein